MPKIEKLDEVPRSGAGLAVAELTAGRLVTISPNKSTGDRSLCQVIWEVASINDGHALIACRHLCELLYGSPAMRLVPLHEYEFYAADAMVAAVGAEG